MGKKDNLKAYIMSFAISIIFIATVYFCLDIFNIIEIPDSLSLAKLLSTRTEELVATVPIEDLIVTEDNIDEWINGDLDENEEKEPEENVVQEPTVIVERQNVPVESNKVISSTTQSPNNVNNNSINKLYYYQLDMYGKMIYDKMYDNLENLKTGTYTVDFDTQFNDLLHQGGGSEVLEKAFQFGINALLFDHPEIYFLEITKIYMSTEITSFGPLKTYRVKIGGADGESYLSESFFNKKSVDIVSEMIETVRSNIKGEMGQYDTYMKIKTVHDFLVDTISYEQTLSKDNIYNIYGAFINKEAVCEGYSKAFKYMMDSLDIPCIVVCGIAQNSKGETESHAWNYVKIDDLWYAVDCTWDDPVIVGTGTVSKDVYTRYFLKGSRDFNIDHIEDGKIVEGSSFVYPTLSVENYGF